MEFDINFIWGILLGLVLMAVVLFLWRNKKGAKSIFKFKRPSIPAFKKEKSLIRPKKVDDTPPDSDWPGATVKGDPKAEDVEKISIEDIVKKAVEAEMAKLSVSPEEKARLEALEESNPTG